MDQAKILNFKKTLNDSSNILIILPQFINTDTISSALSLFYFIAFTLKKKVSLVSEGHVPERFSHLLNTFGIEENSVLHELEPFKYVLNLKDVEKDLDIRIDRNENEINFVFNPKDAELNLSKFTLGTLGNKYDLLLFINTHALEDTGEIYGKNKEMFNNGRIVVISGNINSDQNYEILNSPQYTTASETVFKILETFGATLNQATRDVLFEGIVSGTDGLHRVSSSNSMETVLKLVPKEEVSEKMKILFYGYSPVGLQLRKKIFNNLKETDTVIYSKLSKQDLDSLSITGEQIDGIDYLPFGIVEDIETYALSYPYKEQNRILIESNDIDPIYRTLKDKGFNATRSTNLVCVDTKQELEDLLKLDFNRSENRKDNQKDENKVEEPSKNDLPIHQSEQENQSSYVYQEETTEEEQPKSYDDILNKHFQNSQEPSPFRPANQSDKKDNNDGPFKSVK